MEKGCSSSRTQCGCCGLGEESQVKGRVVLAQSGSGKPTWMGYDDEGGEWQGGGRGRHTCRLYNRQESKSQGREAGMKGAKGEQIGFGQEGQSGGLGAIGGQSSSPDASAALEGLELRGLGVRGQGGGDVHRSMGRLVQGGSCPIKHHVPFCSALPMSRASVIGSVLYRE